MSKIQKRNKSRILRNIIPIVAAFSFIICVIEGYFYFRLSENSLYIQILMNINNVFKTFLFSPIISISDARKAIEYEEVQLVQRIVFYLYTTIVILAPVCTATALLKSIEKLIRNQLNFVFQNFQKRIVVFGYNDYSKELVLNLASANKRVMFITKNELDDNNKLELIKKGVAVICSDYCDLQENELNNKLRNIKLRKADAIVLFDECATTNFSLLMHIVEYFEKIQGKRNRSFVASNKDATRNIKCSISCDDYGMQEVIMDYYNRYVDEAIQREHEETYYLDLKFFCVPEIMAGDIFIHKPLYYGNLLTQETYGKRHYEWQKTTNDYKNPWDTHLVIVGFGELGQNVLLQALNLGNLQSNSTITIDVFDKAVDEKKGIFAKRFYGSNADISLNSIQIPDKKEYSDGRVIINFHKVDIRSIDFEVALNQLDCVTYVAICFENSSLCTTSMVTIKKFFKQIPIAVRMNVDKKVIEYIKYNNGLYEEVFLFGSVKEILTEKAVIENSSDLRAILYNNNYNELSELKDNPELSNKLNITRKEIANWNKMGYIKKCSSRKAVEHQTTKIVLLLMDHWIKSKVSNELIYKKVNDLVDCITEKRKYSDTDIIHIYDQLEDNYKSIVSVKNVEDMLKDKEINELSKLEHRRYCNFMFANGYRYEDSNKDDIKKTNPSLLSWDKLQLKKPDLIVYDILSIINCLEMMSKSSINFDSL